MPVICQMHWSQGFSTNVSNTGYLCFVSYICILLYTSNIDVLNVDSALQYEIREVYFDISFEIQFPFEI